MRRQRITTLLERSRALPLRLLAAPAGAGKTCALAHYLATTDRRAAYVSLKRDDTPEILRARIAQALELEYVPASLPALLAVLATFAPLELGIDDCDRATAEAREELTALVEEAPEGVHLLYGARSRASVDRGRLVARGLAAIVDAEALAFDAEDCAASAGALNVAHTPADVEALLAQTEGWPLAAAWVVRDAAQRKASLAGAFERWSAASARDLGAFVDEAFEEAGVADRTALARTLAGDPEATDAARLELLETRGLFVRESGGALRPYRVLAGADLSRARTPAGASASLLAIRMFGRFEAKIGGTPIAWIRRREAQLFKYLLLKPGGRATRTELCETFWPGTSAHAATQSLRTACSNIRKAIAQLVGYGSVERYFKTEGDDVAVPLDLAVIDVRRFTAHVADGDRDLESGRVEEAYAHYRAAEQLYVGELLSGDFPEPWYAPRAEMYMALFRGVLDRIAEYHRDAGHAVAAEEYEVRSLALSGEARKVISLASKR